jgi:hypothetical protein
MILFFAKETDNVKNKIQHSNIPRKKLVCPGIKNTGYYAWNVHIAQPACAVAAACNKPRQATVKKGTFGRTLMLKTNDCKQKNN